jgi:thiol-disulfide isomerase/thioredoxin
MRSLLMPLLHPGDTFPELTLTVPGGEIAQIPEAFAGQLGVLLFYRGSWCPYCNAQLRAFQRASATLADAGAKVAGLTGAFVSPDSVYLRAAEAVLAPGRVDILVVMSKKTEEVPVYFPGTTGQCDQRASIVGPVLPDDRRSGGSALDLLQLAPGDAESPKQVSKGMA